MAAAGGSWKSGSFQAAKGGAGFTTLQGMAREISASVRMVPAGSRLAEKGFAYQIVGRGRGSQFNTNIVARTLGEAMGIVGNSIQFSRQSAADRAALIAGFQTRSA